MAEDGSQAELVIDGPARPASILRGSPSRRTDLMEAFQEAYVRAVAAAAGCVVVGRPEIDEGVDIVLSHTSNRHRAGRARLEIQMKATATALAADGASINARITRNRYDYFRTDDPAVAKIVVIMHVPKLQDDWVYLSDDALVVRHRAYWVSLCGFPATSSADITVSAPCSNTFDDITLCKIMERVGKGDRP
ncbi:DUF4365 domain-containing protein [Nocardia sputi]|uniref:DUF4365 domain-containing protein n=1 Tax=Nocardia sputi TaxID=2943705 RepID=UPI0020BE5CE2|nr:DUF4365 domain-containing protein [Nocardia sputi]